VARRVGDILCGDGGGKVMNGSLKTSALLLSLIMTVGGLVWGASNLNSASRRNASDIYSLMVEQKESRAQVARIREDLAGIKAEVKAQTGILRSIEHKINK